MTPGSPSIAAQLGGWWFVGSKDEECSAEVSPTSMSSPIDGDPARATSGSEINEGAPGSDGSVGKEDRRLTVGWSRHGGDGGSLEGDWGIEGGGLCTDSGLPARAYEEGGPKRCTYGKTPDFLLFGGAGQILFGAFSARYSCFRKRAHTPPPSLRY